MSTSSAAPVPVTPTAVTMESAAVDQQQLLPVDSLHTCRYPSKKCWNARALKRNGEMHNLCDEHRQKANKNQRRLEQKRKTSKKVVAAKRVRKSRINAKKNKVAVAAAAALIAASNASANATGLARPAKRQQAQARVPAPAPLSMTASSLVTAAKTVYSQAPSSSSLPPPPPSQTFPVRLNTALPSGFFTELMLTENTLYTKQQQQLDLGLMGTMMMSPPHQHLHHLHHLRVPSVTDFLDGDLDSLTDCLDFSTPSFVNLIGGCGFTGSSGSASPIDVCDGLDAVAAVNDFWWHPVVAVDPLLDTSALVMNEEIFPFHQH